MSAFLILLKAFRGTHMNLFKAIIAILVLEVLFFVIIALCI